MKDTIFITWEKHQRTRRLCERLEIPLVEIVENRNRIARYFVSISKTIDCLRKNKPKYLFIQNPSIVLAVLGILLKNFFGFKLIVDAHNEAVSPLIHDTAIVRLISRYILRNADYTVVTNTILAAKVMRLGGTALVSPDFLPERSAGTHLTLQDKCLITFICTYAPDEPYTEVFSAAGILNDKVEIYVTGKIPSHLDTTSLPTNVKLLGYVSEELYWETLKSSHIILDLTTMPNCLVCGAYEALALAKPTILSDDPVGREFFPAAIFSENNSASLAKNIDYAIEHYELIKERTSTARVRAISNENERIQNFRAIISQ